jgi:predicted O-methyltransferase YrrM
MFQDTWRDIQGISGWLTEPQAQLLYETAQNVTAGEAIVEIGSHHGRSTVVLAKAKAPEVHLLAVDPYDDDRRWGGGKTALEMFQDNLAARGVSDGVQLARTFGSEAGRDWAGGPVGMLFVDGAHDYPTVLADLEAWIPHLAPNAAVLLHDVYSSPGVTRAVFKRMFTSDMFVFTGSSRSLACFRRQDMSSGAALLSGLRMLGPMPWMCRNLAVKFARRRGWKRVMRVLRHTHGDLH